MFKSIKQYKLRRQNENILCLEDILNKALAGFVKNPTDNRMEAAKKITEAAGGKLI